MEAGLHTVLVLTGLTTEADVATYPFRPNQILGGVNELIDQI
jgi:NagD protein